MEIVYYSLALLSFLLFLQKIISFSLSKPNSHLQPPPSPPSLPILGHLHLLKPPFHSSFHSLAQHYGPIFSLQLGWKPVLVISSPSAVQECFTQNDIAFADRPNLLVGKHLGYNHSLLIWAPYGPHWRNLRRLMTLTTLSQKQIQLHGPTRKAEVRSVILNLLRCSQEKKKVNLSEVFGKLARNLIMRVVNGKPWEAEVMRPPESMMTVCDFFPVLRKIGFMGIEKEMIKTKEKRDMIFQSMIDEGRQRLAFRRTGDGYDEHVKRERKTLVEELLELQEVEPQYYTDEILKGIIAVLLIGGSETSAKTLSWAMTNILSHSDVLEKAKIEINMHIGKTRLIDESDLPKLKYIHYIINETLRLHPPAPLLLPHFSSKDCILGGFKVSKGTMLLVNAWALHRDPNFWNEPTKFKPERFEKESEEFTYIPFGIGRRACPGTNFATRNVTLVLATLIQCFNWELVENETTELIKQTTHDGVTVYKPDPLLVTCFPCSSMDIFLSQM